MVTTYCTWYAGNDIRFVFEKVEMAICLLRGVVNRTWRATCGTREMRSRRKIYGKFKTALLRTERA